MLNSKRLIGLLVLTHLITISVATKRIKLHKREGRRYSGLKDALDYLTEYGYFADLRVNASLLSLRDISDSIKDIQEMMGLNETGILDPKTLEVMNSPRCSNKDQVHRHHHSPAFQKLYLSSPGSKFSQEYSLYGTKWDKDVVTYSITRYSYQRVSPEFIDAQIRAAFREWERHIPLKFIPTDEITEVDIEIQFTHGEHGDNFPFPPGTSQLAHAFYPPGSGFSGDIHFNDEVNWAQENMLYYTALHEIGHTLGLRHSSNQKSIMYSHLIQDVKHGISLHYDDIAGAQQLYGAKPHTPELTTTVAPKTFPTFSTTMKANSKDVQNHPICQDGYFDAITSMPDRSVLVFRGDEVIILKEVRGSLECKKSERIRTLYNGRVPFPIDASFTLNKKTYLFKGNLYWRTTGFYVDEGYPKLIGRNFHGIPDSLDAALLGSSNQIYFIKGHEFWDYDLTNKVASRHEIRMHWKGIPYDGIDAAYRGANGTMFLFRDGRYWRLNFSRVKGHMDAHAEPIYPRDNRIWWFACTSFKSMIAEL